MCERPDPSRTLIPRLAAGMKPGSRSGSPRREPRVSLTLKSVSRRRLFTWAPTPESQHG